MMRASADLERLRMAVRDGLEPGLTPEGVLQLQWCVDGDARDIHLVVDGEEPRYGMGWHPEARSAIRLDREAYRDFVAGRLELRDPARMSALEARGDLGFLHAMVTACDRPTAQTLCVFEAAEAQSRREPVEDVDRFDGPPDEALVRRQLRAGRPSVFSGWLDWPALAWSFDDLRARYGDCVYLPGADGGEPLSALLDRMADGQRTYSHGCRVPEAMTEAFKLPVFAEGGIGVLQMWLGSRSPALVTGLHREVATPFLCQVIGRKRLLLYSPDQIDLVYGRRAHRSYQQCWVDPHAPDLARFPRFAESRAIVVDLAPGQILLIPPAWFHCAYAIDDVLSISTVILPESA